MIAIQDPQTERAVRTTLCSICHRSVRVNPLKATDAGVICRMCRCKRCSIPMSSKPCDRCGIAHGTPSASPGLCERCFEAGTAGQVRPFDVHSAVHEALCGEGESDEMESELLQEV
jgi:hypothetical protein